MSKLMSVRDFEREITELDAMLQLHAQLTEQHGADPAAEIMAAGLKARRAELVRELRERGDERMPGHELDIIFDGAPVAGHTITTKFLGNVLLRLQQIVTLTVANQVGGVRSKGRLKALAERAVLRAGPSYPGSFRLHLETGDPQFDLLGDAPSPVFTAIDALLTVMNEAESDESVLGAIAAMGGRAAARSQELLDLVARQKANVELSWPTVQGPRTAAIRPRTAARRRERLSQVNLRTYTRQELGRLDEAGIRRGYFEFIVTPSNEVISGRVSPEIIDQLKQYFDSECKALFTVTETVDQVTTKTRRVFRLDQLTSPDADFFAESSGGE